MKRTTVFLTDELEFLLRETARSTGRPRAEIIRETLSRYLPSQQRPRPRSIGMGTSVNSTVTSENVKQWVRDQWQRSEG